MERGAKPAKAKVEARPSFARKSRKVDGSTGWQLEQRLAETLEQQAATSEILRVISSSRTDVQPVFDTIAANALRLCDARFSAVFRFDGELIHIAAFQNLTPEGTAAFLTAYPCRPSRGGTTQRAILTRSIVHMPDIREDPEYVYQDVAQKADYRSVLSVPMLRDGDVIGTITVYRDAARPFPDAQIELLKTFADQAVIAVENVRLFTEVRERNRDLTVALDQKTATSEILRVISQSKTDVQPVFDAMVRSAVRLCGADYSIAARFDGELLQPLAHYGFPSEAQKFVNGMFPMRPSPETMLGRAALSKAVNNVPDVLAEPMYSRDFAIAGGWRSVLAVPMLRDGELIGVISVGRREPGAFPDHLVALLKTFADQAVIAIENVRLFNETKEALERQTATSQILRAISGSLTDIAPVFDILLENAIALCGGDVAVLWQYDGQALRFAAGKNTSQEGEAYSREHPLELGSYNPTPRAGLERRTMHVLDVFAEPGYRPLVPPGIAPYRLKAPTVLAVPLLRENYLLGVITIWRFEKRLFTEKQVGMVNTFADQAVIAIENVRLFTELETRNRDLTEALEQQTATSDILRVISQSPRDVQPVFDAITAAALKLCGGIITVARFDGELVDLVGLASWEPEVADANRRVYPRPPSRETVLCRAVLTRDVVNIPDVQQDADYAIPQIARAAGYRSAMAVPMMREGKPIGAIAVARPETGAFTEKQVALLKTFADQAVIAIENVRLFKELETRNRDLTEALEQQTATSDILRVISQSPTDVQPVFDTIAAAALKLCSAGSANVYTFDGELIHLGAIVGANSDYVEALRQFFPRPPSRETGITRAILTCSVVEIPDVLADPEYPRAIGIHALTDFRSVLAVPLVREGSPIGAIAVGRPEPGPFPDKQIALLQTFADQAVIAIENVRLFTELEKRNRDVTEALEQQTATSEILRVISRSQTDAQPVFETIGTATLKLCRASSALVTTFDGELIRLVAMANVNPEGADAVRRAFPQSLDRSTGTSRAILTGSVVAIPDVLEDHEYAQRPAALAGGFRSVLAVPLVREGSPIGAIAVGRPEPGPFPEKQIALLQTFADQAVIAIENVRLFTELQERNRAVSEALEQQTATSDILRVISQSPTDALPVFDTIAAAALRLCSANSANVYTFDGELIHLVPLVNLNPGYIEAMRKVFPRPPSRDTAVTRAILACSVVAIPDVLEDAEYKIEAAALAAGFRSGLAVPLVREGSPIGAIVVGRPEPGPFPDKQIALLQTFADQAVIAIENVRLFTELQERNRAVSEALEQQTATSDILRVISQSQTDVQPVFDTIAAAALNLCRASAAIVLTFDGELIHLAAFANMNPEGADALRGSYPRPPSRDTGGARAILMRSVVAIPDVLLDPDYATLDSALAGDRRSVLSIPLMREGNPIGAISVVKPEPGPFPDKQIALLKTFADQAVIAIENARLFKELEARTAELTQSVGELRALGEVGQAVSSTLDLGTVLKTIVSRAVQLTGLDGGSIYEYDEGAEEFRLQAAENMPQDVAEDIRKAPTRKGDGALGRTAITLEPTQVPDTLEGSYRSARKKLLIRAGYRALLAVPLLREDHLLGGLLVNRKTPGAFAPEIVELMKTFATQSALAIQNARLFREIEEKSRQLETASRHKSEFLANMSHELRTPLNAIIGFSEVLIERMFGEVNEKQEDYLKDIHSSGRHLLALINDILDLSKVEAGRMELELSTFDLPYTISNAMTLVRERGQQHEITFGLELDSELGQITADERKLKQILLNLLSNAVKFTPDGGRIDLSARRDTQNVVIAVRDTGIGIAPRDQEAVFEEFRQVGRDYTHKQEGTGLGLALTKKFVELHGGRIRLESEPGKGSTFTFTIPVTR